MTDDQRSFEPRLSSDGRRVYFSRGPGGTAGGGPAPAVEAWVLDIETGEELKLFAVDQHELKNLTESPDGQFVAFAAPAEGEERVSTAEVSSIDEPTLLPRSEAVGIQNGQLEPAWSPDGTHLAYLTYSTSDLGQRQYAIHIVELTSLEDMTVYTPVNGQHVRALDWTADGNSLVVTEGSQPTVDSTQSTDALLIDISTRKQSVAATDVGYGVVPLSRDGRVVAGIYLDEQSGPQIGVTVDGDTRMSDLPDVLTYADLLDVADCALPESGG